MSTTPNRDCMKLDLGAKKGLKHSLWCFDAVCKLKQRWNKWLTGECRTYIVNERCDMPANLKFTASDLNRAMGSDPKHEGIEATKNTNMHGVCKSSFKEQVGERRTMLTAHCVTNPKLFPQKPGGNAKWHDRMVGSAPQPMLTRQPTGLVPTTAPIQKRRRRNDNDTDAVPPVQNVGTQHEAEEAISSNPRAQAILNQSWWDTGDAIRHFGARDGEASAKDSAMARISRLQTLLTSRTCVRPMKLSIAN
jgi:hypothetical protein